MDDVLKVRIRHRKALLLGLLVGSVCLFLTLFSILGFLASRSVSFITWLTGVAAVFLAPFSIILIGIAVRRPIALRLDRHGISGFYTAPAEWSEIDRIGIMKGPKGAKILGFRLRDPVAFRDRQTPLQRFTSWLNGAADGFHISVPETILKDVAIEDITVRARAFHASAGISETHNTEM